MRTATLPVPGPVAMDHTPRTKTQGMCGHLGVRLWPHPGFLSCDPSSPALPDHLVTPLLGGGSFSPALKPKAELKRLTVTSSWDSRGFNQDSVVNQ